jgi:hypothetical protein
VIGKGCRPPVAASRHGARHRPKEGDPQDLYVVVFGQNQSGQTIFNWRLNHGSRIDLPITAYGSGNGSVASQGLTTSTPQQSACGSALGLGRGAEVTVVTRGMDVSPC